MTTPIPSLPTRAWVQQNDSDILKTKGVFEGNLLSTFNVDLSEVAGKVRLGKRMILNTNSDDVASLIGVPVAFRSFANKIYTAAGVAGVGKVFNTSINTPDATFAANAAVSGATPPTTIDSLYSDLEVFAGQLFVTTVNRTFYYLDSTGASWTTGTIPGVGVDSNPHMLAVFSGTSRMYCTYEGKKIISWDSSTTPVMATAGAQYTLDMTAMPDVSAITFIRSAANRIWIGTLNANGGRGAVYTWDGSSGATTALYKIDAPGALSCVIKDDVPYITDSLGNLWYWNGGTFQKLAQLNKRNTRYLFNASSLSNNRFVHPNGMGVINGKVSVLLDLRNFNGSYFTGSTPATFTQSRILPSGIWQYDLDTLSFHHSYSLASAHVSDSISDYGQFYLGSTSGTNSAVGGLAELILTSGTSNGSLLAGAAYNTDESSSSGVKWAIFYDDLNDTKQKAGYFTTVKIPSKGVLELWQKVYVIHNPLLNASDKIVVKYKAVDITQIQAIATTTSSSTFTTTDDLSSVLVGDEVEFVSGVNGGICAHITAISLNAGTYTVTVDETITSSAHTSRVHIDRWTKATPVIADQTKSWHQMGIKPDTTWIQFKVWMLWTGKNELESLKIASVPMKEVE